MSPQAEQQLICVPLCYKRRGIPRDSSIIRGTSGSPTSRPMSIAMGNSPNGPRRRADAGSSVEVLNNRSGGD